MILVLCGSIAAGCAIITLAYGAEKILERAVKPPKRKKEPPAPVLRSSTLANTAAGATPCACMRQ